MKSLLLNLAQRINAGEVGIPTTGEDKLLENVLNAAYFLAGAIAVIVIIIAGIMYATSGGDSGRVSRAKNMILYAVIGIVLVLVAFSLTQFVIGVF